MSRYRGPAGPDCLRLFQDQRWRLDAVSSSPKDMHSPLREGCALDVEWPFLEGLLKNSSQSSGRIPKGRVPREDSQLPEAGALQGLWGSPKGRGGIK